MQRRQRLAGPNGQQLEREKEKRYEKSSPSAVENGGTKEESEGDDRAILCYERG